MTASVVRHSDRYPSIVAPDDLEPEVADEALLDRPGDEDLVLGADAGAPVDLELLAGELGERAVAALVFLEHSTIARLGRSLSTRDR